MPTDEQIKAKDEVDRFVKRFGEAYRPLAWYAALPLVLTPELLHFLRNQFLRGPVPWVAEVDFLLSELCHEVGYEQYALKTPVREFLIGQMRTDLGEPQMEQAARLILDYARHLGRTTGAAERRELEAQQWSAMLYLADQRDSAIQQIAESFRDLVSAAPPGEGEAKIDEAALARLARITQMLEPQLASCPQLVHYAQEFTHLLAGQESGPRQSAITVMGTSLPAPIDALRPAAKPSPPPALPARTWEFDAVLFHTERDASWGQQIMAYLLGHGMNVLQQVWERLRGESPEMVLERLSHRTKSLVLLIGSDGHDIWQGRDLRYRLERMTAENQVIPVLLPGAPPRWTLADIPQDLAFLDLSGGLTDGGLRDLEIAIRGGEPPAVASEWYLVDGDNFIAGMAPAKRARKTTHLDLERKQRRLLDLIRITADADAASFMVAFSAAEKSPGHSTHHGITVIHVPDDAMDVAIEKLIIAAKHPQHVTVMSQDRRVLKAARRHKRKESDRTDFIIELARRYFQRVRPALDLTTKLQGAKSGMEFQQWLSDFANVSDNTRDIERWLQDLVHVVERLHEPTKPPQEQSKPFVAIITSDKDKTWVRDELVPTITTAGLDWVTLPPEKKIIEGRDKFESIDHVILVISTGWDPAVLNNRVKELEKIQASNRARVRRHMIGLMLDDSRSLPAGFIRADFKNPNHREQQMRLLLQRLGASPPAEETPTAEEAPAAEKTPPAQETPPAKEIPPAQKTPPAKEIPPAQETPPAEETPKSNSPVTSAFSGYQYDVFISYRHLDDQFGWVTRLAETLRQMLSMHRRGKYQIFVDRLQIGGHEEIETAIGAAVKSSAVLVIVVSENYLSTNSVWSAKERALFRESLTEPFETSGRVFVVYQGDVNRKYLPLELQNLLGYSFWEIEKTTGKKLPMSFDFSASGRVPIECQRLGDDVWEALDRLRKAGKKPVPSLPGSGSKPVVFLAEVTDELFHARSNFQNYLEQMGFRVVPGKHQSYRFNPDAARRELPALLRQATLVVQLLGRHPIPSDDAFGQCIEAWLFEQAQQEGKRAGKDFLRWRALEVNAESISDGQHRSFVFEHDVIADDFERFKNLVGTRLQVQQQSASMARHLPSDLPLVLVICEESVRSRVEDEVLPRNVRVNYHYAADYAGAQVAITDENKRKPARPWALVIIDADNQEWLVPQLRSWNMFLQQRQFNRPVCALIKFSGDWPHGGVWSSFEEIEHDNHAKIRAFLARIESRDTKPE